MSKSFFVSSEDRLPEDRDASHSYTFKGREAELEVRETLEPLLNKWVDAGYSPHELFAIISTAFSSMSSRKILAFRRERNAPKHFDIDPNSTCECRECCYARGVRDGKGAKDI